ncbi:MAG: oligosaccharide flippase family protein [Thermoplasmataceae archaeon]
MVVFSGERSTGIDAIFQFTGSGVQLFSGALFYLIIVRLFQTGTVGAIAFFLAIVGLFTVVFSFGLGTAAQHFIAYHIGIKDYDAAKRTIYKILIIGTILAGIGTLTLILLSDEVSAIFLHSSQYSGLVRLLSIDLFGNLLFGLFNGSLLGLQNFRKSALINSIIWGVYYFSAIGLALYLRDLESIVIGWIIGISLGVLLEFIVVMKFLGKYTARAKTSGTRTNMIMLYSFPVLLSSLIGYGASYADRFIVTGLLSLSALGVYNFALLAASSVGFIAVPFNNILLPKFSHLFATGKRTEIRDHVIASSLLLSALYVPAALGIAALSPEIIYLLAGSSYTAGALPLAIIMVFSAVFVTQNIYTQAVASVRKTYLFVFGSIAALSTNIVISILLIPRYGLFGASLGFSSVYAANFAAMGFFAFREKVGGADLIGLAKIWIAAAIMFAVVWLFSEALTKFVGFSEYFFVLYIALGFLVYSFVARYIKIFNREDHDLVISMFPEKYSRIRKLITVVMLH